MICLQSDRQFTFDLVLGQVIAALKSIVPVFCRFSVVVVLKRSVLALPCLSLRPSGRGVVSVKRRPVEFAGRIGEYACCWFWDD